MGTHFQQFPIVFPTIVPVACVTGLVDKTHFTSTTNADRQMMTREAYYTLDKTGIGIQTAVLVNIIAIGY